MALPTAQFVLPMTTTAIWICAGDKHPQPPINPT